MTTIISRVDKTTGIIIIEGEDTILIRANAMLIDGHIKCVLNRYDKNGGVSSLGDLYNSIVKENINKLCSSALKSDDLGIFKSMVIHPEKITIMCSIKNVEFTTSSNINEKGCVESHLNIEVTKSDKL